MQLATFLEDFQDVLQCEDSLSLQTELGSLEEWDSMAMMSAMAYFDKKFNIQTTFNTFKNLGTVADVVALAGAQIQ